MRTIQESIEVLERWRDEEDNRAYELSSHQKRLHYPASVMLTESDFEGDEIVFISKTAKSLQEALDRAASAVEGE